MIFYNVTIKIEQSVHEDWLNWMKTVHIPDVMATGCFEHYRMGYVLHQDETDGLTYSIQYACKDMKTMQLYAGQHAPKLQKEHTERYKDKFVGYRSFMELVQEG